jgi:LCP family protein required for cell wall assembly
MISMLVVLVLLIVFVSFAAITLQKVFAFGSAISTQKNALSTQTGYMSTSDRVNILVMGYGGSGHDGAYLTDSMMIMSLLPQSHHTTLISVPRDLWVQNPANSGNYTKINAVYPVAAGDNNQDPVAGGDASAQKVSLVTGLNVQYWLTINFAGFRDFINAIGGIDVYVPDSFNACYPKNDDASVDASWIKVQFNKGMQHMDGNTAIEYARAREPLEVCGMGTSENQAELTDFARSIRQQIIVNAALSKVKSIGTWPHLYSALNALQHTIYTNLSFADLAEFALHMDLKNAHHVGISTSNVLVNAVSNDGQDILLPANNNWQAVVDYVKQQLYN